MKTKITITLISLIFMSFNLFAEEDQPDSMYIHFTTADGSDSMVIHALANIDSIVYYAPIIPKLQVIDWNNVTEGIAQTNAVTDTDGNFYSAVKIGTQIWMAENLRTTKDSIGNDISNVIGETAWANLGNNNTDAAYCWYNDDIANKDIYGALYTYAAALNVCPKGWHLPNDYEWTILTDYLVGDGVMSGKEGTALKATSGWNSEGNGTDDYRFAALPGGCRGNMGTFYLGGKDGYWWSNKTYGDNNAYYRYLLSNNNGVYDNNSDKSRGHSIRCLKD